MDGIRKGGPGHLPPRAALFDLDGTLVDTEPRSRWAWTRLFAAHGATLSPTTLATFPGRRGQEVLTEHQHLFPGRGADELFAELMRDWWGGEAPAVAPVPGAGELVRDVHRSGTPAAVVSSGRRHDVEALLGGLGLRELFATVVTSEDVQQGKPHPEGFLTACARLGVPPERAVVFEDAPAGIAAAKSIGARCVAVTTSLPAHALAGADLVVPDLTSVSWPPAADKAIDPPSRS